MWPPKNKDDLIQYNVEIEGATSNLQHVIQCDETGNFIIKNHYCPTLDEFKILSKSKIIKKIDISDFHKRLKDIIESAIKLNTIAYFFKFDHEEKKDEIQKIIYEDVQNNPFKVIMPDCMNKKDKTKRKKELYQYQKHPEKFYSYKYIDEEIVFYKDNIAGNFFALSPKKEYLIKSSFDSQQKIKNIFQNDTDTFLYLKHLMKNLHEFYQNKKQPVSQKNWETFLLQNTFNSSVSDYQENLINPLIMNLVDQSRRFLYDTLICEHWQDIAQTKPDAQQKLKKNKSDIYTLAEKFGYINQSDAFIVAENIRNLIAHPSRYSEEKLKTAFDIALLYQIFVYQFIDANFLKKYYDQFPFSFPFQEINNQWNQYQSIRDAEFLTDLLDGFIPNKLKDKSSPEKLKFLVSSGILKDTEIKRIQNLILSRNAVAHGQLKKEDKIPQDTVNVSKIYHRLFFQKNKQN